jgi:hypothetical protein
MKSVFSLILVVCSVMSQAAEIKEWTLNSEVQSVWMPKNNVAIPGDSNKFNFRNLTGTGSKTSFRGELLYRPGGKATEWRLMIAPLQLSGTGRLQNTISFQGTNFASGVDTFGSYKFNSYRFTYRRAMSDSWMIGATLKIRDAKVLLRQGGTTRSKSDLGVVPLLNIYGKENLGNGFTLITDFDGSWAPQGRAFDLSLQIGYDINEDWQIRIGGRVLEGGADVPAVYNFTQLNYLTIGTSFRF